MSCYCSIVDQSDDLLVQLDSLRGYLSSMADESSQLTSPGLVDPTPLELDLYDTLDSQVILWILWIIDHEKPVY